MRGIVPRARCWRSVHRWPTVPSSHAYFVLGGGRIVNVTPSISCPELQRFDEVRGFSRGQIVGPFDSGPLRYRHAYLRGS